MSSTTTNKGSAGEQRPSSIRWIMIGAFLFAAVLLYRGIELGRGIDTAVNALIPPPLSAEERKKAEEKSRREAQEAIAALSKITDYEAARWHPLHFKPAIDTASNEQCLACHQEVLTHKVRPRSPAGVEAAQSIAWYQTLDTYTGSQDTFHERHLTSDFAKQVMSLKCTFCHQGNDVREEAPGASATAGPATFALRKVVNPTETCLLCHGRFPSEYMEGLEGPWHKLRENFESADVPNGCLVCHTEQFRTNRHKVNYLKADAIEKAAKSSSDVCFGCHGGRAWYRNTYPYPRHSWPGMDAANVPEWAKSRPTESRPEHLVGVK